MKRPVIVFRFLITVAKLKSQVVYEETICAQEQINGCIKFLFKALIHLTTMDIINQQQK